MMEKVAETIRERLRIQGDIKVLTAQGRLSGLIVGLLPFVVFFIIFLQAPGYFNIMFGPPMYPVFGWDIPLGVLVLVLALFWQLLGGYLIYKIISINV